MVRLGQGLAPVESARAWVREQAQVLGLEQQQELEPARASVQGQASGLEPGQEQEPARAWVREQAQVLGLEQQQELEPARASVQGQASELEPGVEMAPVGPSPEPWSRPEQEQVLGRGWGATPIRPPHSPPQRLQPVQPLRSTMCLWDPPPHVHASKHPHASSPQSWTAPHCRRWQQAHQETPQHRERRLEHRDRHPHRPKMQATKTSASWANRAS
mmetsp:Transcript_45437/g.114399  ORF Transcript_45437/g.114399 Transcript_45437/m.114399 type:complete len:216 (+) Transcript_45437:443-1090(+)